jgi:CheY-like chemotaxis protein
VVDDDAGIQEVLETALRLEGYEVALAADGQEAIRLLTEQPPDLILFDMTLPHMSGVDFAAELGRRGLRPRIPMVLLTGDARGRDVARQIGTEAYFEKPVGLADLLAEVARLVGGPPSQDTVTAA